MVCYCCVKGCSNSSNNKKKDPNSVTSFHAFPTNPELKTRWLRAIGRPNWTPPTYTRICSAHFNYDQINYDGRRVRIKDDEIPVNALPLNSNFEASNVEVCRICLATDLKMYSLQDNQLGTYMDSIVAFSDNHNIEGLPQFVCYQCAAHLIKCYKLVEKSMITQATLLDIFAQNGYITKKLIKELNRFKLNLKSPLSGCKITNYIHFQYDEDNNTSHFNTELINDNEIYLKSENDLIYEDTEFNKELVKIDVEESKINITNEKSKLLNEEEAINNDFDLEGCIIHSPMQDKKSDDDSDSEENVKLNILKSKNEIRRVKLVRSKVKKKRDKGLTPDETDMKEYFDIVQLSLQEQIEEWERRTRRPLTSDTVYECETCFKIFAHLTTYHTHIASHEPDRGKSECLICKLRFKSDVLAKSHANRAHGKKFYCKSCPKVFNNVGVAKKHRLWHVGFKYKCKSCPFTTAHESALGVHARRQHRHSHACADCGQAFVSARGLGLHRATAHRNLTEAMGSDKGYRCELCEINFTNDGARRVHILTSSQHRKKPDLCEPSTHDPSLQNTCKKCGIEFQSLSKLISHSKTEHPRQTKKCSWGMPGDSYPTQCEICGEELTSRKNHWWHVRKHHPRDTDKYQRVVTAVCETCGKGFRNSTKLHLHQLRHGSPGVRCGSCPRQFYDKYALRRHAATHAPHAPHGCRACGRAFKRRANLQRHARVHTDATPYECTMCSKKFKYSSSHNLHVRTVHYKLPHPPRKKRAKTTRDAVDAAHDL